MTLDSRTVAPGDLFVAVAGERAVYLYSSDSAAPRLLAAIDPDADVLATYSIDRAMFAEPGRPIALVRARAEEDARHELERRIDERTRELSDANVALSGQIEERRRAEAAREGVLAPLQDLRPRSVVISACRLVISRCSSSVVCSVILHLPTRRSVTRR